jgi:hypothetical protein
VTKFLVLYNATASAREQMAQATPEQAKAGMDAWMAWAQSAGEAIVDLGAPLQPSGRVTSSGMAESDAQTSGYSILQADSAQALAALLEGHPHLQMAGASIDILEALPIPGM